MNKKSWLNMLTALVLPLLVYSGKVTGQEPNSIPAQANEKSAEQKAEREKQAFNLLEQVVNDAQLLRLTENRINAQIDIADLFWDSNQGRAQTLFTGAGDGIAEMTRAIGANQDRRGPSSSRSVSQLRQKLVLTVARHDVPLAYQLLAVTRPTPTPADGRNARADGEDNLEQTLLSRIAALDPKLALQNAEELLDKGQFPRSLPSVLAQLQRKDKEAAAKLEDKMTKRLQSVNLLAAQDAGSLALALLRTGPRAAEQPANSTSASLYSDSNALLAQASYVDLLGKVLDAGLKAVPEPRNQRTQNTGRGRRNLGPGAAAGSNSAQNVPTQTQIEQANSRMLMNGLRSLLPQVDQYLPSRAMALRDKLTELGMVENNQRALNNQVAGLMRQGSTDDLLALARTAPPQMQSRIYQRAATKALEEGNADQARQIASDYLDGNARDRILQQVEFKQVSAKVDTTRLDELRATLNGLRSDDERIDLLIQLSFTSRNDNPKLAVQLLDQAKQLTNRRAVNYQQLEKQLKVAVAFRGLEPSRSFEVLEPGISQLNELLSAAATLSGFEVSVFRDGELPLDSRNNLSGMISRYGQALGMLARDDFGRAQALADRFHLTEARILARISIVRGLLSDQPGTDPEVRGSGSGNNFRP